MVTIGNYVVKYSNNYLLNNNIIIIDYIYFVLGEKLETVDIILFNLKGYHAHDVADYLGKNNICLRAGNFCCPYLKKLK